MLTTEKLEAIHPKVKIAYERMLEGVCGAPNRMRNFRREATKTLREILICRLLKANRVPDSYLIALNISETEKLKKYLLKKYKYLGIAITENELNDEVAELVKLFDCVISIAATEGGDKGA